MSTDTALEKIVSTDLYSGLKTTVLPNHAPFAVRVSWINWDSGFRDSGLQIEDLIVAVDGAALAPPPGKAESYEYGLKVIGQHGEYKGFAERSGLSDGSSISVTVLRKDKPGKGYRRLDIKGRLKAARAYYDADGKEAHAPGGPTKTLAGGPGGGWMNWYSERIWEWERYLDGGWLQRIDNHIQLKSHLEQEVNVESWSKQYPGEFSKRLREDFELVRRCLEGAPASLPPDALAFREENEKRQQNVLAAGDAAWEAFLKSHAVTQELPKLDLVRDDRAPLLGKLIALRDLSWRYAVVDGDKRILAAEHGSHWCFLASDHPGFAKLAAHQARYKSRIAPRLGDKLDVVGRVLPQTRMVVTGNGTFIGLSLEPVAVRQQQHFFVDLTSDGGFAGEDALKIAAVAPPADNASPTEVVRCALAALKAGNDAVWRPLFATWEAAYDDVLPYYNPYKAYDNWDFDWNRARNMILTKVVHAEPVWESEPSVLMTGKEFERAPKVDAAFVEVDHLASFDDAPFVDRSKKDRVFGIAAANRLWQLQRLDGGPWKIVTRGGI